LATALKRRARRAFVEMATNSAGEYWSFELADDVGVWAVHDVEGLFDHDLDEAQEHFRETAGRDELDSAVIVFEDDTNLSREVQGHIAETWSRLGQAVALHRTAYVADGVRAMAVKGNVDVPDTELKAFNDRRTAVEWASEVRADGWRPGGDGL
jgi:hypothetical protein